MTNVPQSSPEPLLRAVELRKSYVRRGFWGGRTRNIKALDGVSLNIHRGSCSALIGESGSGKSTLVACLARLEQLDEGEVWFESTNLSRLNGQALRSAHARFQLVFQDAYAALNPGFTAIELVEEPLVIQKVGNKIERRNRAGAMLRRLGIPEDRYNCRPQEFSGGQRKRIALARALVMRPRLLILDEVFSGLDLLIAAQILKQLMELRAEQHLTLLFASHDLSFLAGAVDSIAVMQHGQIVEQGSTSDILNRPQHLHTKSLVFAHERMRNRKARGAGQ
jgi:ABC-type glutathione transport system ATPase component